ncbi:MAG: hypothetical protein JXA46_16870 [Dehalococcoidales bacterium]|nr:hypothetical protein [Dehalococcoidales bacterium]
MKSGGSGYLPEGSMCFGTHKEYLVIRRFPERPDALPKHEDIKQFDMTGRTMKGQLMVASDYVETGEKLLDML